MASPTLTPNSREEQDKYAESRRGLSESEATAFDDIQNNFDRTTDDSQENDNTSKLNQAENSAGEIPNVNVTGDKPDNRSIPQRIRGASIKKKGAFLGIIGGTGIIGVLFSIFGPISMVISLTENLVDNNDGAKSAFERRISKVLGLKMSDQDNLCKPDTRVKCKMGRITTKGLSKLAAKGVVALDVAGNDLSKSSGRYPSARIAGYMVDGELISTTDIKTRLTSDPKLAAKVFGRSGAFNVRFEVWRGKHLKTNFYDRWKIKRTGGIADGKNKSNATFAELSEKVKGKVPDIDGLNAKASANVTNKTDKMIARGKKGGTAYLTAVGSCVAVKTPSMIAGAVASVQIARLMPVVQEIVLSPGSKNKASALTNIQPEDVAAAGTLLTATDANGKSALDSKYLQSAIGVNTNKTGVSKDFAPGYSILSNPTIRGFKQADNASESTCNSVLSPQAMYTAIAVNSALTVAASTTIIGGVLKVGAEWLVGEAVSYLAKDIVEGQAKDIIEDLAQNDELDNVLSGQPGEKMGDAIGSSAMTFFSSGAAARNVPVLKESQLVAYNNIQIEQAEYQRSIDIASLSPFDVSSKYTFLGSILNNVNMGIIQNGKTNFYPASALSYLASSSLRMFMPSTYAVSANSSINYCSYANDFNMQADNGLTPAVNAAGLPCYGYIGNISTETAIDYATGSNADSKSWVKDGELAYDATLDEITEDDTRLSAYIEGCGAAAIEAGEWMDTAAGCTIESGEQPTVQQNNISVPECTTEGQETCFNNTDGVGPTQPKVGSVDESEAVAAFAIDYQLSQMIDGDDEETFGGGGGVAGDDSEPSYAKNPAVQVDDNVPSCTGSFTAGASNLKGFVMNKWPLVSSVGGYACRKNTANASQWSVHASGRALDIMIDANNPEGLRVGNQIRNYLINNAERLGIQRVIWNRKTWSANKDGWRDYNGPSPHTDHLHVEINVAASQKANLTEGLN